MMSSGSTFALLLFLAGSTESPSSSAIASKKFGVAESADRYFNEDGIGADGVSHAERNIWFTQLRF